MLLKLFYKALTKISFKEISGGLNAVDGFSSAGINSGLRKSKPDLSVIYSEKPCVAVGSFTKNIVKAAPVIYSMKYINKPVSAVIVNSANANACTGEKGIEDTYTIASYLAEKLNLKQSNVLVYSTGVIGKYLPVQKIVYGIDKLKKILEKGGNDSMAKAILTTDLVEKEVAVEFKIKGKKIKIAGIAKGSGMIAPDMATMLSFIVSDVNIEKSLLNKLFKKAVANSFNRVTVDGDMSTNDSVLFLTNRFANNKILTDKDKIDKEIFYNMLLYVMNKLAKKIIQDGEGATKIIRIRVNKASSEKNAKLIADKISKSLLVKTAIYGSDANWGRVLAVAGSAGVKFNPDKVIIKFGNILVFDGEPVKFSEKKAKAYLDKNEIDIVIELNTGKYSAEMLTCDLTEEYIKINSKYRT